MNNDAEWIPTRKSLLGRLKNWADEESWGLFFERYWRLIYTAARRAGLADAEAQDVVQETIISVLNSMKDFEYRSLNGSFKSWLLQLTGWRIQDQERKRMSRQKHERKAARSAGAGGIEEIADPLSLDWQAAWDADWEQNLLQAAIQRVKHRVDAKAYQVFDLLVYKEWPVMRVARALQVNRARVYVIKHRVSKLLKEEIAQIHKEEEMRSWSIKEGRV